MVATEHEGQGDTPLRVEISEQLRQEFIDETIETLQSLDIAVEDGRHGRLDPADATVRFRRTALLLRGQAANFGFTALATLAHRLDEYLTDAPVPLPPRVWDDLLGFTEQMTAMVDGRLAPDADPAPIVRALPPKLGFDFGDIHAHNVEVLLVMPHGAQTRFVERELQQCGYRVSIVADTILAFAMVTQTEPDLVIISAVMPALDGTDLAIALASMPSTRNIPIAVITSLNPDDDRLRLLPRRIPVVYKGASFGDDLFRALDNLFLI
jgi:CheY-like chemotaxis protein/HPt (histidine-containing phosphotransfer) domain-containing protein